MSAAVNFDLARAAGRSCHWAPDYWALSLLKPQAGRVLNIGPRLQLSATDAAAQSLAASTVVQSQFTLAGLGGGWPAVAANQAVLFESVFWRLTTQDNSGKLQILMAMVGDSAQVYASNALMGLPYTMPALNNAFLSFAAESVPLEFGPTSIGPSFFITISNTDGAAAHTYKRTIGLCMRIIDNIDMTTGPSVPGSGVAR